MLDANLLGVSNNSLFLHHETKITPDETILY